MSQQMQSRRFEYKYVIDEPTADAIRTYLRGYLTLDEHDDADNPRGYAVCSLYLDNPQLTLYKQTVHGHKNRFKLRIRFYDDNDEGPAFLEIKRRENFVIRKKRATVTRDAALQIIKGARASPRMLYKPDVGQDALENFCNLARSINAEGCAYVVYQREAYVCPESDQYRVTFDRQLVGGTYHHGTKLQIPQTGASPEVGGVVLELKFTDRFPEWMQDLTETFNLQRASVPKYCLCVDSLNISRQGWVRKPTRLSI